MSIRAVFLARRSFGRALVCIAASLLVVPAGRAAATVDCATAQAQASLDRVGAAMFAWLLDVTSGFAAASPLGAPLCPGSPPVDVTEVPPISVANLRALLVPVYIDAIPEEDPWGKKYDYRLNLAHPLSADVIALRSSGADASFEGTTYETGETGGPAADLVIYNTTWIRQPPRLDPVSRQLVTAERIDILGDAIIEWLQDVVSARTDAPAGGPTVDLALIAPVSASDLATLLTPFYALCIPAEDGWGHPLDLRLNDDVLGTPVTSIRSPGRDGVVEGDVYDTEIFPADDLDRDLVWSDGQNFHSPSLARSAIFADDFESAALWGTWSCGPGY